MPEVRFDRVEKRYGQQPVIRDFSLTIREGEFFTLVGPSGCGKSTVLNLVAGLEPVTSGEIYFDDRPVTHLSPKDRDVAMVFQSYALYPHKTVFENLAFPLQLRRVPRSALQGEVRRVAGLLGLAGLLAKKPAELSGGERQRVALGRALIRQPAAFLMDEPLSNLDQHLRVQTRSEIKRLHAHLKTTTLYVTHDQEEALVLSDRLAVLKQGCLQQVGTPQNLYDAPANVFVASFIGYPSMNLLDARIENDHAVLGAIRVPLPRRVGDRCPGDMVSLGIRPEQVLVSDLKPVESDSPTGIVRLVEPVGAQTWVTVEVVAGERSTTLLGLADRLFKAQPGECVAVSVVGSSPHLFDPRTGDRIHD
jgi:multiple sugar transport system ATP-binding protein